MQNFKNQGESLRRQLLIRDILNTVASKASRDTKRQESEIPAQLGTTAENEREPSPPKMSLLDILAKNIATELCKSAEFEYSPCPPGPSRYYALEVDGAISFELPSGQLRPLKLCNTIQDVYSDGQAMALRANRHQNDINLPPLRRGTKTCLLDAPGLIPDGAHYQHCGGCKGKDQPLPEEMQTKVNSMYADFRWETDAMWEVHEHVTKTGKRQLHFDRIFDSRIELVREHRVIVRGKQLYATNQECPPPGPVEFVVEIVCPCKGLRCDVHGEVEWVHWLNTLGTWEKYEKHVAKKVRLE